MSPDAVIRSRKMAKQEILIIKQTKLGVNHEDDFIETIRILQENPLIVHSLCEREKGDFVDEEEFIKAIKQQ